MKKQQKILIVCFLLTASLCLGQDISTEKNSKELWKYFKHLKIYSQKNSWEKVSKLDHIPTSHLEGSIIISQNINW